MSLFDQILSLDKELFLYVNSKHEAWLDPIMLILSSFAMWIIVFLLIVSFLIYRTKKNKFKPVLGLVFTMGINAGINYIVKILVARPRPLNVEEWNGVIHAIEKSDVSYSFYSAHSSNSFAIAVFSLLYIKNKLYSALVLLWALIVAYSRLYVGKHYPIDIVCGIIFGSLIGYCGYKLFNFYMTKKGILFL